MSNNQGYSNTNQGSGTGTGTGTGIGTGTGAGTGIGGVGHHHGRHHDTTSSLGSSPSSDVSSTQSRHPGSEVSDSSDDAMTRSEDHLLVGKEKVNAGTAALNKYVTTEKVSTAVPIVREKAVVEREPITDSNREAAMRGPDFKESHYEVNLMEERAVAEKQTVPIERVRLRKELEQTQQYVEADLRKEHIQVVDPTKQSGLGGNNVGGGIGKDSYNETGTGTGIGTGIGTGTRTGSGSGRGTEVGSSYSGTDASRDRQIASDDPNSSASRQL